MEFSGKPDDRARIACRARGLFQCKVSTQALDLFRSRAAHQSPDQGRLDDLPGLQYISRLLGRRPGDMRTALRHHFDDLLVCEPSQHVAYLRAADTEDVCQAFLAQLGSRAQAVLEDGCVDLLV